MCLCVCVCKYGPRWRVCVRVVWIDRTPAINKQTFSSKWNVKNGRKCAAVICQPIIHKFSFLRLVKLCCRCRGYRILISSRRWKSVINQRFCASVELILMSCRVLIWTLDVMENLPLFYSNVARASKLSVGRPSSWTSHCYGNVRRKIIIPNSARSPMSH